MNNHRSRARAFDTPAFYRIEVQGRVDPGWIKDICDVAVSHGTDEERRSVTTITGEVADQAALAGILNLVYNFGYPLLSVQRLRAPERADPDSG